MSDERPYNPLDRRSLADSVVDALLRRTPVELPPSEPFQGAGVYAIYYIWNTTVTGFGNHDPGSGRYNQARSSWDVLHPGRPWADRLRPGRQSAEELERGLARREQ